MNSSYGPQNYYTFISNSKHTSSTEMKIKEEKRPLLDSESQSDSGDSVCNKSKTVLNLNKPINTGIKIEDFNPISNRKLEHPTTNLDTMIHLLKGNVGTGILAMPDAFRNAGWVVGLFGTLFMGVVSTHCMHMLVSCAHELCRRKQVSSLSFAEVTESAFSTGPESVRKFAYLMKALINIFLCITQVGFCCVYFVFVAINVHDLVKHYFVDIDLHWYFLLLLLPMILLNWVKNLKYLTPVSLFAGILTCTGLMITFFYMLQGLPHTSAVNAFASWERLPLYFGVALYAFEGIGMILPLENNMKTPQDFGGLTGVLNTGMVLVTCLYTAVGFFGYLKYGELARLGSVTLYLPSNEILAQSVRLMMALAIFLSFGLQFYVPFNIVWPVIKSHCKSETYQNIVEYIMRTLFVILTFCIAALIPNLGAVISLVGAFSSSTLSLIFPPIIEIITFWPNKLGKYKWMLWKDLVILIFGFFGFLIGSYVSILNILYPTEHD